MIISKSDLLPGAVFTFITAGNERVIDLIIGVRYHRCHILRMFYNKIGIDSIEHQTHDLDILASAYDSIVVDIQKL